MKQRTCETCRYTYPYDGRSPCWGRISCGFGLPCWTPLIPWKRIGWIAAFVALAAFLLFCALSAAEEQKVLDSIGRLKSQTSSFIFYNQVPYTLADWIPYKDDWFYSVGRKDWKVTEYVVWEITRRGYHVEYATISGTNMEQININGCAIGVSE